MYISIAIDGPSGAGKSSISKKVANELGFIYVDTGALYRAVGYNALNNGVDLENDDAIADSLKGLEISFKCSNDGQRVMIGQTDVSELIRTNEVSMAASRVSAVPKVRAFLFDMQQKIAQTNNIIMDGRDIGTVVLPNATVKVFLTADVEERAKRRYIENQQKGISGTYEEVLEDMKRRDYNDTHREIAPLKMADDAVLVNTTGNEFDQSVKLLSDTIKSELRKKNYEY